MWTLPVVGIAASASSTVIGTPADTMMSRFCGV
jgi:hypothetical protein